MNVLIADATDAGLGSAGFVRLRATRSPDSEGSSLIYPTCPASRLSDFRAP
mgnify:FL=1